MLGRQMDVALRDTDPHLDRRVTHEQLRHAFAAGNADCVFINSDINDRIGRMFGQATEGTFEVDPIDAIALILLHEAGHFH